MRLFASNSRLTRLFQAALDACLDSPLVASLSVHGLHFTVYAPSSKVLGKSKWGLSNGGLLSRLRPLSAICAQSSTIVHFCGLFGFRVLRGTFVQNDDNRRQSWTIVDKYLKPPFAKPPFRLSRAKCRQKVCSSKRLPKLEPGSVRQNEVFENLCM